LRLALWNVDRGVNENRLHFRRKPLLPQQLAPQVADAASVDYVALR